MGIKELWPILNPYCERKPLYELQGKVVAIDLAGWICESLCVVDYEVQARFYLRNLFFRTCYLLLSGVTPVFVLEGTAPSLKHAVISKRNKIQFRGAQPNRQLQSEATKSNRAEKPQANKGRTRFNYVLKQCEELIKSMGLQCVQGPGEAEAFCAQLNAANLVDGVISQDSDCFAYGARRVYRNFSMSMQGTANAIGGAVDVYDIDVVTKSMDFGRNKMIIMALLCGCDYCPEGVGGVGRDAVLKFFALYSEVEIMERVSSWRANDSKYTSLELKVDNKMICVNCGHYGRVQKHTKSGCDQCKMHVGCDSSLWKEKRLGIKTELQIRKKAMQVDGFPSQEVIDEFLQQPIELSSLQLEWGQPNLVKFLKMMSSLLQWEEIYCFQKFLPLLTRWQLFHYGSGSNNLPLHGNVCPDFIKKKRAPKGVASFEIIWKDEQNCFNGLIPDEQLEIYRSTKYGNSEEEAMQSLWSTIEPIDLVEKAYPDLVNKFNESKTKKKTKESKSAKEKSPKMIKKSTKRKKKCADSSLNNMSALKQIIDEIDADVLKTNNSEKKTIPRKKNKVQTLDRYLQKDGNTNDPMPIGSPVIKTFSKVLNLSHFSFDLNDSIASVDDDANLSGIINQIVSRPPNVTEFAGKKLRFDNVKMNYENRIDLEHNFENLDKENKENILIPIELEESLDEFDLIVMRKSSCKPKHTNPMEQTEIISSSTPVIVDRFLTKHFNKSKTNRSHPIDAKLSLNTSNTNETEDKINNSIVTSSFFAGALDDEIDLFERSIDFKNMKDDESISDSESESESSCPHATLDNFLGMDFNYVPISDELKNALV